MSDFIKRLGDALQKAGEAVKTGLSQLINQGGLDAVCSACVLVINANDQAGDAEIATASRNIAQIRGFEAFTPEQILRTLDAKLTLYKQIATPAIARERLIQDVKKVPKDSANIVVQIAIAIGSADGHFDPAEKAMVKRLIVELGLDEAMFPELGGAASAPATAQTPAKPAGKGNAWS